MAGKGFFRGVPGLGLLVVVLLGSGLAYIYVVNDAADRNAREFCAAITIGADISDATKMAAQKNILFGHSVSSYQFYFFHFFAFDKAVCEVTVAKGNRVVSKVVEVELD